MAYLAIFVRLGQLFSEWLEFGQGVLNMTIKQLEGHIDSGGAYPYLTFPTVSLELTIVVMCH